VEILRQSPEVRAGVGPNPITFVTAGEESRSLILAATMAPIPH
jgi:hypothetical protein